MRVTVSLTHMKDSENRFCYARLFKIGLVSLVFSSFALVISLSTYKSNLINQLIDGSVIDKIVIAAGLPAWATIYLFLMLVVPITLATIFLLGTGIFVALPCVVTARVTTGKWEWKRYIFNGWNWFVGIIVWCLFFLVLAYLNVL